MRAPPGRRSIDARGAAARFHDDRRRSGRNRLHTNLEPVPNRLVTIAGALGWKPVIALAALILESAAYRNEPDAMR